MLTFSQYLREANQPRHVVKYNGKEYYGKRGEHHIDIITKIFKKHKIHDSPDQHKNDAIDKMSFGHHTYDDQGKGYNYYEAHEVETKHLIPAIKIGHKIHLPKSRKDFHADIMDRMPQKHKDYLDQSEHPGDHLGYLHMKTRRFIRGSSMNSPHHATRLDSTEIPYSHGYKNFDNEIEVPKPKNRKITVYDK